MTSALSAALGADTDHVACFDRDGAEHRWPELVAAAARVCASLQTAAGERWALDLDDSFQFAAALLGCWAARKTPVLAPRPLLETSDGALAIDGSVGSGDTASRIRKRILWDRLPAADRLPLQILPTAELVLYTSGSTGVPKEVTRRVANIEAELQVLESLWGHDVGASRVYSTVSHRHVYGMLFRLLWPLVTKRPFATFDLQYPEQLIDRKGDGHALICSPALLKRIGHFADRSASWSAIFSSGGLLPPNAARDAVRVLGACPAEVLGSTETSGVAWRRQREPAPALWQAMPRVEIRIGSEGFLEVRSPFSGQPGWLAMGDLARLAERGTFELLGRGDHLAKIEDVRVSLAAIERCLLESPWIDDAAAVALEDGSRQYVGVVLKLSAAGASEVEARGRRAFKEILRIALRGRLEAVALPRKFRYVETIPVDAQGKRHSTKLKELFRSR